MKVTTTLVVAAKNVGHPDDSLEFEGPMLEVAKALAKWMHGLHMGSRLDVCIARTLPDARAGLERKGKRESVDDAIEALFTLADFEDSPNIGPALKAVG